MSAPRTRTFLLAILLPLAAALSLAACGDDERTSSTASASPSSSGSPSGSGAATVDVADNEVLGTQVLVDSDGNTLYLFEKDDEGNESYCSGACAKAWPPLTVDGEATAGEGLEGALTTFTREDGSTQVSYAEHPLYLYAGDKAPGDAHGNGIDQFGAEWYAMDASGAAVEDEASSGADDSAGGESSETSDDSAGGYGY